MLNKIYVAVKTLIEKTAHCLNQEAPLPSLGNLPPCWEPMY